MLVSPALAAFFAFLLARRLTGAFWPSLLGGWLFGFSAYTLGQETSHLNLTLVFMVPAIVHLVIRALDGELQRRPFVALLTLALLLQLSFSLELFATLTMFGALALLLGWLLGGAAARGRLRAVLPPVGLSYLAAGLLASPYLYYALKPGGLPVLPWRTDKFSADLLGFVVPTELTRLGGLRFVSTSEKFTAGFVEGGAYLGIPLLVALALAARAGWRRVEVRLLTWTLLAAMLLALGGHLHVRGSSSIPLPWAVVHRLPVLGQMLPARFMLYAVLCVSLLTAIWLSARGPRIAAWLLALVSVAFLWPATGRHYWQSRPDLPALFSTSAYRHEISRRDTVLVLPVGIEGQSMLWQGEARLHFAMASGYVVPPEAPDPYKRWPIYPTLTRDAPVPDQQSAAASFLAAHRVTVVALDARATGAQAWLPILRQLGWAEKRVAGAILLRPQGIVPEPAQPSPPPSAPVPSGPLAAQRAARAVTTAYLRAFAAGDAARFCSLLSEGALAAQIQRRGASRAQCGAVLSRVIGRLSGLRRAVGGAHVGAATLQGTHGYVALRLRAGTLEYVPVRTVRGRWRIDGAPQA
jgi:hypothetical protein